MDIAGILLWLAAMEVALDWEVEKTRVMQESLREDEAALQEKELERLILKENKEQRLAEVEDGENLLAHFVDFIDALDRNDPQAAAHNFDEKAMMDSAFSMLNNDGRNYGVLGLGGVNDDNVADEGTEIEGEESSDEGEN